RAALADDLVGRGPAGLDEVPGAGGEVGERVPLVQQLAVVVPPATHLAAAPDMGDRHPGTAVEEGEPGHREPRVDRDLVRAVPVEQERDRVLLTLAPARATAADQ